MTCSSPVRHRGATRAGESARRQGEALNAFCWELEFPEVFYDGQGSRRPDAGFSCVLGNPPWDKIKPERDGFYLQYDPLIRQFQGTEKNRHIERLHRERPEVLAAWERYEPTRRAWPPCCSKEGSTPTRRPRSRRKSRATTARSPIKRKTTGGDPDLFKFFLERAWQLAGEGRRSAWSCRADSTRPRARPACGD